MTRNRWMLLGLFAALAATGCQGMPSRRAALASSEPSLNTPEEPGTANAHTTPSRTVTWVDHHPLFSKPREYYDGAGTNKAVKVAAATVVGIPVGIVGELKQIVVGRPPDPIGY
jgi:hypothetical protein